VKRILFLAGLALVCTSVASRAASSTLLIHDTLAKPFSLANEIAPIQAVLQRFDTHVETLTDSKVAVEDLKNADFIVLAGISGLPKLKDDALKYLQSSNKPVVAIGAAASFASLNSLSSAKASKPIDKATLGYRGREWALRVDPFYDAAPQGVGLLAGITSTKGMTPLAWRVGNRFGFASLPSEAPLTMVFSDILLDFYGAEQTGAPGMVFVVQDYNPSCNPATLRRVADYFAHQKTPFVVTTQMKEIPLGVEITPREEFLDALRYAQARGARIFLRGGNGPERSEVFQKEGIVIEGSEETPSVKSGLEIGNTFIQRTPGEAPIAFPSAVPLRLEQGGWLLPANVHSGLDGPANEALLSAIRDIIPFRGGLAVVAIPAWMRFQDILSAVQTARSTNLQVVDPVTRFPLPRS
jgi:hypothetical protein